ncbi:uncharacterized protein LOC114759718 isoform X2 [Neltuma alba]|uniref:uncharacterized protein LOC114759718 isoform X2 n=1 Tax=Neltuma alba TaxID=207710 RepID=UPI0010A38DE6|nr:uncharacterized protein LOC114759718 isoform X2 [Prosopis alba]
MAGETSWTVHCLDNATRETREFDSILELGEESDKEVTAVSTAILCRLLLRSLLLTIHCLGQQKKSRFGKKNNVINFDAVASDESVMADFPTGQTKEVKISKSSNGIRKEPCYTDPVNEYHSKMARLCYAESGDISTCLFKANKRQILDEDISTVVLENSAMDVLQPGCIKEAEIVTKDPVAIEKSTVDDLPAGWTKEVKIRKNGSGIKKDPYYTDPVNGYVFRSKKDAWRYIESGDITKCLFKPTKRQIEDEDKSTPSSTAKRQKSKQPATKRRLFVGKKAFEKNSIKLSDTNSLEKGHNVKVSTTETVVKIHSLENAAANAPEMNKTSDPGKNHVSGTLKKTNEKNHRSPSISNKKGVNVPHRFSRRLAGVEPDQVSDHNIVVNKQVVPVPKRSLRKDITTLDDGSAIVSSQQLNVVQKIEHMHDLPRDLLNKSNRISQAQADSREQSNHNSLSNDYNSQSLNGATKTTGETGKLDAKEKKSSKQKVHIPHRASKRLAGFEPEITNPMICDRPLEYKGKMSKVEANAESRQIEGASAKKTAYASSSLNVPRVGESSVRSKSSKIPPKTCEQQEKLGEKLLDDEKSEPQLSFAFHYSWSDPSVEFAIKTLTGALPVENSVDEGPVLGPEIDEADKTRLSKNVTEGQGPVLVPEVDEVDKIKLFNNVAEGQGLVLVTEAGTDDKTNMSKSDTEVCSDKSRQLTPKKSKNKKEPGFPRRLSKRLAGHEPELAPADRAVEYASKKSCKDMLTAAATSGNGALKHIDDVGEETQLDLQAPTGPKRVHGASPDKSDKSNEVQIAPNEQLQKVEAEKVNERSEPEASLPFGDSWSDPCFEFAIKTLTGPLPVDGFEEILPVMTPDLNCPPNTGLLESVVEKCINEEVHDNMNQSQNNEDSNKVCQLSKQHLDQPESFIGFTSCENAPKFTTVESHGDDAKITRDLNQSQNSEDISKVCQLSKLPDQPGSFFYSTYCENAHKFATVESHGDDAKITKDLNQLQDSEDINKICQFSKQLLSQPESFISSTCCENAPKFVTAESHGDEAKITRDLNQSQNSEDINKVCQLSKQLDQPESFISSTCCENAPKFGTIESHGYDGEIVRDLKQSQNRVDIDEICQPSEQLLGQPDWLINSTSCEIICQPSKDLLAHPELRTSSASCENDTKFIARECYGYEAKITNNLDQRASLNIGAGNEFHLGHQSRNIGTSKVLESSNNIGKVLGQEFAPAKQPQFETRIENEDKSELQFSASLMDSWSDPCLEFAFKTLTGAPPEEEDLSFQGCFQDPANNFNSQKDARPMLPDFGSPSLPRADISFHYNVKSMPGQQISTNSSSILPAERVSPHWFPVLDSQKHCSHSSKNSQGG